MCGTCGCGQNDQPIIHLADKGKILPVDPAHNPAHDPLFSSHSHSHEHSETSGTGSILQLEREILDKNDHIAQHNRRRLEEKGVLVLNLVSSPGAGKTSLLERTIRDLRGEIGINVIEGDQATTRDAERIQATGCQVVQVNTGTGCHLEAEMVEQGLKNLDVPPRSILMIENVGNLVCPALFDLGEQAKVLILSVTEGEDKPLKYPHMFTAASILIVNKIDLLPYVPFKMDQCLENARKVNPKIRIFPLSALTGEGLDAWYDWLRSRIDGSPSDLPD